jgi:hypothetical protein
VQLVLRMIGSYDVAARARAVVRRDDRPKRWCWWSGGRGRAVVSGGAPKALSVEYIVTLCRVGAEVVSMLVGSVVWGSSYGGLTSSSSLERPVFAPLIVLMTSSLRLW